MRIAVFGGSFNPVHIGHLALADDLRASLGYDRVILVPANVPPHKAMASGATAADRLAMLALACESSDFLEYDDCEIARGGVSYTIETIRYLTEKNRSRLTGKLGFAFGQDLVAGFGSWRDPDAIAREADLILARRPDQEGASAVTAVPVATFPWRHIKLDNPLLPISSSEIRARISSGKGWRYLVPEGVYRYIVDHGLYE